MKDLPKTPVTSRRGRRGFELEPHVLNDTSGIIDFLRTRRSAEPAQITGPGPDDGQLELLLEIAARTPDHGKMEPWRFIVIRGRAKDEFAAFAKNRWQELNAGEPLGKKALYDLIEKAPLIIVVVSRAVDHPKVPAWEQRLSAGAACMNMLTAATAMGLAMQWRSGWPAEDEKTFRYLGLTENETIAGLMFTGSLDPSAPRSDRRRPFWRDLTTFWQPDEA